MNTLWICFLTYNKKFIYVCFYIFILFLLLIKLQKIKKTEEYINDYVVGKRCIINAIVTDIPKESTLKPGLEPIFTRKYIYFPVLINDITCQYLKVELKFYAMVYVKKEINEKVGISVFDLIAFKAAIQRPIDEQENWKFQFKKFLYANGYMASVIIQDGKQIINKQKSDAFDVRKLYFSIYKFLDTHVSTQKEYINFLQALLFGTTYKLSEQQKETYINSGTYHFFAVSGFSVMVLYIFLLIPFKAFLLDYKISGLLGILIIWVYIAICGFVPTAQRAGIIITFLLLANLLYRKENHLYSLLFAFIFILIFDNPFAIFDVSFQYSFITYSAIILILTKVNVRNQQYKIEKIPFSQTTKSVPAIIHSFTKVIAKLNEKRAFIGDSLPIIGRLVNTTTDAFLSVVLMTLVASISISPLTIKYFGLGKIIFFDNIIANCISSLFFSIYFIISLIFLLLLFIFGSLPNLFWYAFKGVPIMERILSKITSNNTYFGMPTEISVYLFYILLSAIAVLIYTRRLSIFKGILILVCMQLSFLFFCDNPKKYTTNSIYSTTSGKNAVYYYIKTNNDITILSINKFNKQLFYQTLGFLRYIRFLDGNITFVTSGDTPSTKSIRFRNFYIHFRNIEEFQEKNLTVRKIKVSKKLYNLFISTNNISVLYLQSVNKKWLINFLAKNKIDVIEIANKARKPSTEDILCNWSNLIINRSDKFNITCDKTKILKTSKTIYLNAFLKN